MKGAPTPKCFSARQSLSSTAAKHLLYSVTSETNVASLSRHPTGVGKPSGCLTAHTLVIRSEFFLPTRRDPSHFRSKRYSLPLLFLFLVLCAELIKTDWSLCEDPVPKRGEPGDVQTSPHCKSAFAWLRFQGWIAPILMTFEEHTSVK